MANYFIYGYYGFGNYGDDLLLEALLKRIRAVDAGARFVIRTHAPISWLASDPTVRFWLGESLLGDQRRSRVARFFAYRAALQAEVRRADVLVIGGGTLFIDKGRMNWSLFFLHEAASAAKRAGRRVVIVGVAIDILAHPASVWLTRRLFRLADFAALRDALSLAYFQDWQKPPRLAADLAWLLPMPALPSLEDPRRPLIGLNFIDYFRTSTQSTAGHQAYCMALLRLLERHGHNCDFRLIVMQCGIGQRDDWFAETFRAHYPAGEVCQVTNYDTLVSALTGLSGVVTTRFHLALQAARAGVATCIVDHELKLTALAQELSLPSVSLAEFVADAADPIERLQTWDAARTAHRAASLSKRAEENFLWMST